jgi:hypothetical protein
MSRPSIFDMTGRAKWDAWNAASKTHSSVTDAERRYLEIARSLGWDENVRPVSIIEPSGTEASKEEDIWDAEDGVKRAGSGMGASVSTMAPPILEDAPKDQNIHSIVLSNNTTILEHFLQSNSNVDINATDEYVSPPLSINQAQSP